MIKDAASTATAEKVSLSIETAGGYTVYDNSTKIAKVQVTRGAEDSSEYEYIQISFVIAGESYSYILPAPKKGTTITYDVRSPKGKPDKIEIAPVVSSSLKNVSGEVVSEFSGNIPEAAKPIVLPTGVVPPAPEEYAITVNFERPNKIENIVDCISPSVCIARGNHYPLYNSLEEGGFDWNSAPSKTLWAYGSCINWKTLTFQSLYSTVGGGFGYNLPGNNFCLKLTEEQEYWDVKFNSWATGNSCPKDFSYNRTDNSTGQKVVFSYAGNNYSPDCISPSVCIARGSSNPLYNSLNETYSVYWDDSPKKTLWASGNCSSTSLDFQSFYNAVGGSLGYNVFNGPFCLKLTEENKFYTVSFNSWESGPEYRGCGGFSYSRTFYGKEGEI